MILHVYLRNFDYISPACTHFFIQEFDEIVPIISRFINYLHWGSNKCGLSESNELIKPGPHFLFDLRLC